jgi:UDP-N-acetylglucosamine--N-acetylmuramyl-(pentapeptide) pyrophosphoryl-undecaprenol N-acetylglucosamine transferase
MNYNRRKHIIISGGGTGGHVFPALAIANGLKKEMPDCEILFVGAEGRLEMDKVPAAGYEIVGLPVAGIQRSLSLKNLTFFAKLFQSLRKAGRVIKSFNPDIAVGVGGYASFPVLFQAGRRKIPTLIQEQNSYAGLTNRLLSYQCKKICVAYEGMEKYFPKDKIVLTGNPVREEVVDIAGKKDEALRFFGFENCNGIIFLTGGSLGSRTLNESVMTFLQDIKEKNIGLIWQTGKVYKEKVLASVNVNDLPNVKIMDFITRMDLAYAAADVIIARAGACTVSELCIIGKAVILVPSPNVAEDHQTKNAMALVKNNAAIMVKDTEAKEKLMPACFDLMQHIEKREQLANNIREMALPDSVKIIIDEIKKLL